MIQPNEQRPDVNVNVVTVVDWLPNVFVKDIHKGAEFKLSWKESRDPTRLELIDRASNNGPFGGRVISVDFRNRVAYVAAYYD